MADTENDATPEGRGAWGAMRRSAAAALKDARRRAAAAGAMDDQGHPG
jgi:hypothetical protein